MAEPDPLPPHVAPLRHEAGPEFDHPGARRPDRRRFVDAAGVRLATWEWGEPDAPPVLLAHGGFDFAGTFDGFAPRLADAGYRVVSWDQRGHGDSSKGHLYSWNADLRDAAAVIESIGPDPIPVIGHSKGGALLLQLGNALPHRISKLVNMDGLPCRSIWPDIPDHQRTRMVNGEIGAWLDHRRASATKVRRPGTVDELAERRGRVNTRLDHAWLCRLVRVGGYEEADGWRWKIDPAMRMGGFGPWRPEWSMPLLPALSMPVLCLLALETEVMGWHTTVDDVEPFLPPGGRLVALDGLGHFLHIEDPDRVAALVLEHLAA